MDLVDGWLRTVLPDGCAVAVGALGEPPPSAFADEEVGLAACVEKRRREFRTGRQLVRQALAQLGYPPCPILSRAGGDPAWPIGIVGSISHTDDIAAAVVGPSARLGGLGLDLESGHPLEPDLVSLVCRADEMADIVELGARGFDGPKLRFVAKEAYFKAVFPVRRLFLDFLDARVDIEMDADRFEVEDTRGQAVGLSSAALQMSGHFARMSGHIGALVYFPS